jgi:hypothetical protein
VEEIKKILDKFTSKDADAFAETVDMLYKKGIPNGVFQDYGLLMDVMSILAICENIIKEK